MIVKEMKIGNTIIKIDDQYVVDDPQPLLDRIARTATEAYIEQERRKLEANKR